MNCKECEAFKKGDFMLRGQLRHTCMNMFVSITERESEATPKWCPLVEVEGEKK